MILNEGNMLICYLALFSICVNVAFSYNNRMFTLLSSENVSDSQCGIKNNNVAVQDVVKVKVIKNKNGGDSGVSLAPGASGFSFISIATTKATDPLIGFEKIFHEVLYGHKSEWYLCAMTDTSLNSCMVTGKWGRSAAAGLAALPAPAAPGMCSAIDIRNAKLKDIGEGEDYLAHWPTGQVMRAETFQDKSSVHLPFLEYMHRGHCKLKITKDYMQTAVNAFAIFISGDLADVERLPGSYVLQSARTIAMMRVAREKLAATWTVVKGATPTHMVTFDTLEKYRPLFKYVNGREMARLNLSDNKILSFIGTHPDLNRHQVGVVANKYIQLNPYWTDAKYLNMMNNLLCGVPMIFMRRIPEKTYLQLTHQIFYHIRACDPLQRRFYLAMMMRTLALGKSYSWSAREVSRLGLLLAEVSGPDLSAINPEAMSGITAQVMLEMPIHSLRSITEMQLRYLDPKPLNILARKLIAYQTQQLAAVSNPAARPRKFPVVLLYISFVITLETK